MANFADSVWNAAQYKLNEMMQKPEFKHKPSAALSVFLKNTQFLIPASERERLWNQKPSDSIGVTIKTLDKQTTTAASARAAAHTGNNNDATTTTATYVTYAQKFKYSIKESDKHVFNLAEMVAAQIRSASIALHAVVETAYLALLNTYKTQVVVSSSPQSGTWDGTAFIFEVNSSQANFYFQRLIAFMQEQYYSGNFDVVNNMAASISAGQLVQQGQGNQTNLGWQMMGLNMVTSTEYTNPTGYTQASYIIPEGTIGVLPWIPDLNRRGFGDTFGNGGSYRTMPDPLGSGLTFAVHEYATGADTNSTYGETQDIDIQVEISVDLAPVIAPMSTSNLTPIVKAGLLI
jgi:hypothetical protein